MSELDPHLKLDLTEAMTRDRVDLEARRKLEERSATILPPPSEAISFVVPDTIQAPEAIKIIKLDINDTIEKMRVEEQKIYSEKIRHAQSILNGARENLKSSQKELAAASGYGLHGLFSRATGYTSTMREQVNKESAWVAACERQLALLKNEASKEKDPSKRHPALAFYDQASKLEREGNITEALAMYRRASFAIGSSAEARQDAIERSGAGISALNQSAVKNYVAGLQEIDARLSAVTDSCRKWETGLKMGAAAVVMAPAFVLSIPAGLAVGLIASATYGVSLFVGQHYTMGRDFKEALREAWGETVDLATLVVKNALGGALFKTVGAGIGFVFGQGPLRLAGNILYSPFKLIGALRTPLASARSVANGASALCGRGWNALRGAPAAGWQNFKSFMDPRNSSFLKALGVVKGNPTALVDDGVKESTSWLGSIRSWSGSIGSGLWNSAKGVAVAPFKAVYNIVSLPVKAVAETVKLLHFAVTSPLRLVGYRPPVPFLAQQPWQMVKTVGEFVYKDGSIFRGHIARFFTDMVVPMAPRAISTGSSAFLTGATVSGIEEVTRARAFAPTFEDYLKKKYGDQGVAHYETFSAKDKAKEREEWQAENRIDLRNILYTAGINGVTTGLAAVIRVKKPTISAADRSALTRASDEAKRAANKLGAGIDGKGKGADAWPTKSDEVARTKYGALRDEAGAITKTARTDINSRIDPVISKDLGKYDVSDQQALLNSAKKNIHDGAKVIQSKVKPGEVPVGVDRRELMVAGAHPEGFKKAGDDLLALSRDLAARTPSNAYRNLAATVIPMSAHAYMTSLKNMSDPNLRPGESTYSMQDMMNGVFYTLGGIKFGEGYTAGFNAARSRSLVFQGKPLLPEKIHMMKTGEGKALFGNFTSELVTDTVKGATLYYGAKGLNAAFPDLLPKVVKFVTGLDPLWFTEEAGKLGERAFGTYQSFKMQDHKLASLKTKTLNEIFEDTANANGFSLESNKGKKLRNPHIAGLFLPPAEAEKRAAELRNEPESVI